ncbi:MAG TPA: putative maltokinase, partial [Chloroflexota bacterium]|nr:putative maltokinase [Chloroflexota bacterium]
PEPAVISGQSTPAGERPLPALTIEGEWLDLFRGKSKTRLEEVLAGYVPERRWFGGKARRLKGTQIVESIPVPFNGESAQLALVKVEYTEGDPETYVLPLARTSGEHAAQLRERAPHAVVAQLRQRGTSGESTEILYDALAEGHFADALLDAIARRRRFKGSVGELNALAGTAFRATRGQSDVPLTATVSTAEQSNSSLIFGDRLILKVFRKLGEGINPDYEVGRFLTESANFPHTAPVVGAIEYNHGRGDPTTVALLQGFVPNEGDAWRYTLDAIGPYFERVVAREQSAELPVLPEQSVLNLSMLDPSTLAEETIGGYLEVARHLGQRTAEMHLALASLNDQPAFAPEPFSALYQRSLYQSLRSLLSRVFHTLDSRLVSLPADTVESARGLLGREGEVLRRFRSIVDQKINASRIRCHGDFHLGQVLYTGRDFVIIDFEGEPARSLGERRIKRSPLIDVAGMLRSFHYAASTGFVNASHTGVLRPEDLGATEPWVRFWHTWVSAAFLKSYLATSDGAPFIPANHDELAILLDAFLMEKAIYELGYELNNRPAWVKIPLGGIVQLLGA